MVCYPLIEQVRGVGIVVVGSEDVLIGILMILKEPADEFGQQVGILWVNTLRAPEIIGLSKDGEAK